MPDYRSTAKKLAAAHKQEDPQTAEVYLFPDAQLADVRLLEVSGSAPRSGDVLLSLALFRDRIVTFVRDGRGRFSLSRPSAGVA